MIQLKQFSLLNDSDGLDLTPLIDVVFTLIVFLILTMGTSQVMTQIQLSKSTQLKHETLQKQQSILIEVNHKGKYWKVGDFRFSDFDLFKRQFIKLYGASTGQQVTLALSENLPVKDLISLMDFLSINQFSNIKIVSEWIP